MTKEISEDDSINNSDSASDEELPLAFHLKEPEEMSDATKVSNAAKSLQEQ